MENYIIIIYLLLSIPFSIHNLKDWYNINVNENVDNKLLLLKSQHKLYYYFIMFLISLIVISFTSILFPIYIVDLLMKRRDKK